MNDYITVTDSVAPEQGCVAYGVLYESFLDAHFLEQAVTIPRSEIPFLESWMADTLSEAGALRGLAIAGVPEIWLPILRWAGVPLSLEGPLHWGIDIISCNVSSPQIDQGVLKLPQPENLASLTSLGMRPVRHFIGSVFGIRLQAANGISCYLWAHQAVLVSRAIVRAGGFLHGPNIGQRTSLAIEPGAAQVLSWSDDSI